MPEIYSSSSLAPYWQTTDNKTTRLYLGDVREVLYKLPSQSVQSVVTSPPYWALRDYKTGSEYEIGSEPVPDCMTWGQAQCGICYICTMVSVFRALRRVLRDDGTLWLNLGDTYASSGTNRNGKASKTLDKGGEKVSLKMDCRKGNHGVINKGVKGIAGTKSIKTGNLIGIPWRVALALQNDGWILRQEIIWHKPNPMPDSVKNRCTKAHEQIFLFAKHLGYYYDSYSIREKNGTELSQEEYDKLIAQEKERNEDWYQRSDGRKDTNGTGLKGGKKKGGVRPPEGANKRTVWSICPASYPGAHYATFPPKLIEPCILAGSRKGNVVLDPFMGSGTTAEVCIKNKRHCIGIELSEKYITRNTIPRVCRAIQKYRTTRLDLIPE